MKSMLYYLTFIVLIFARNVVAQTVIINDNIDFVPDSFTSGANHRGTIIQRLVFDDPTSVWFNYDGSNLTAVSWNVDEESDWYVVNPGDAFGPATIGNDQFTPIFTTDNSRGPVLVGTDEFYLGVATDDTTDDSNGCIDTSCRGRDVFGWVRLKGTVIQPPSPPFPELGIPGRPGIGSLEMLGNAVAYGSLGIIVGTAEVVPEPSSLTLGWLALVAFSLFKRRQRQGSHF